MKPINEIISTIDDELTLKNKKYLTLAQANKLLSSKGLITINEKVDLALKKLIETNQIPHAYQTSTKPKQWRIPLSTNKQPTPPPKSNKAFSNQNSQNKTQKPHLTKELRNGLIAIFIIAISIFGIFSNNDSDRSSYYINATTYAAKSKMDFDNLMDITSSGDVSSIYTLEQRGNIKILNKGTQVFLVKSHFSYCTIRTKGSTQKLWILTDKITKN